MIKNLNANLNKAKTAKKGEFYTQLSDIENELKHYKEHFKGKTILCNCDDPRVSNFFRYFYHNFEHLGLIKLIASSYKSETSSDKAIYLEYTGDKNGDNVPDPEDLGVKDLQGDGDFRSDECIELLKEADIVVTNPPFSLFREYVAQLVKYDKKFIITGNQNAITYKEIFLLIKNNRLWLGNNSVKKFEVEDSYTNKNIIIKNGKRYVRMGNVCWFTNIDMKRRHEGLILYKNYSPEAYSKYDNYDAINVDRIKEIPVDYEGCMGVPITFLDKYNPDQFEILGITQRNDDPLKTKRYTSDIYPNANDLNARGVIIHNGVPKSIYARIIIKHKHPEKRA